MFGKTAMLGRTEPYSSNFVVIPPSDVFQDMIDKKIFSFINDEDNDNNNNSNPITINDLAKFMPPVDNDLLEWIKLDRPKSIVICNRNDDE